MKNLHKLFTVILLASSFSAFGQTAQVIQLSPQDTAKAKLLYDAKQNALENEQIFMYEIRNKYLVHQGERITRDVTDKGAVVWTGSEQDYVLPEWLNGFEYSADFKFIVPVSQVKGSGNVNNTATGTGSLVYGSSIEFEQPSWDADRIELYENNLATYPSSFAGKTLPHADVYTLGKK